MKKKKTYLRPAMTCVAMDTEMLLAGSGGTNIPVSKEPATGPACSKGRGDMPDSFSLWDDEDE